MTTEMVTKPRILAAAFVALSTFAAADASADGIWYTSVNGPQNGMTQGMLGMGALLVTGGSGGPGFTGGFNYGIADPVDFRMQFDLGVLLATGGAGVVGIISPDFVIRPLAKRNQEANFSINLGPEFLWGATGAGTGAGLFVFGMKPGFGMSVGSEKVQATMNMDFPIYLAAGGSFSGTGTSASIRPSLAVEGAIGSSTNLFLRIAPQFLFNGGFAFITITAGVTF